MRSTVAICFLMYLQHQCWAEREDTEVISPSQDTTQCAQELVEWCKRQDYGSASIGVSVSNRFDGTQNAQISCITNSKGSECEKNGSPWFACSADRAFTYKGQPVDQSMDDGICKTRDSIINGEKQMEDSMKVFKERMSFFGQQMRNMQQRLFGPGFPFFNNYGMPHDVGDSQQSERPKKRFREIENEP